MKPRCILRFSCRSFEESPSRTPSPHTNYHPPLPSRIDPNISRHCLRTLARNLGVYSTGEVVDGLFDRKEIQDVRGGPLSWAQPGKNTLRGGALRRSFSTIRMPSIYIRNWLVSLEIGSFGQEGTPHQTATPYRIPQTMPHERQ